MIASIRDKGQCPCPRCLMPLSDVEGLGTPEDMQCHLDLARVDDETHRHKIQKAQDLIFKNNHAVASKMVEAYLKDESLMPTAVGLLQDFLIHLSQFIRLILGVAERVFEKARAPQV